MKTQNTRQIAKTISILSLFIALSVGASNVFAFPCSHCKPPVQYAQAASVRSDKPATVPDTTPTPAPEVALAEAQNPVGFVILFWARLGVFLASLI